MDRQAIGKHGEQLAEAWYRQNGYKTAAKNYRTRFGEIDLVLQKDGLLIFCEVKTRRGGLPGAAAMAVTPQKQQRLIQAARGYLMRHKLSDPIARFDVAEVYCDGESTKINVITNAFSL